MTDLLALRYTSAHPIYRVELEQAAYNHGFRKANGVADGWLWFKSDEGVPGEVALANGINPDGSPWFLAVEHAGVSTRLADELADNAVMPPPAHFRGAFAFPTQGELRAALSRVFQLARSLPTFPLAQYEDEVAGLGDTEVERIVKERVGQTYFRRALIDYWRSRCPLTGIEDEALLRASHIVPWAHCRSDEERLDVFNGLLLSAHWDAVFDRGLVSFDDDGKALWKPELSPSAIRILAPDQVAPLSLTDAHRHNLAWHRKQFAFDA